MEQDNIKEAAFQFCLRMGDNSLILGHRISEWCGHGPILEEDIALTNVALDLVGQSRLWLSYAGEVEGKGRTEDNLAYLRDVMEYKNALLVEQPNGDFGWTIVRTLFYSMFAYQLYKELQNSKDEQIASIASKAIKEVSYHLRHSSEWLTRLGDGTEESHQRVQKSLDDLWMYTGDLFDQDEQDKLLIEAGIIPDFGEIKLKWEQMLDEILERATLKKPENPFMLRGSKDGKHTEHLGFILADLQYMQKTYPGVSW